MKGAQFACVIACITGIVGIVGVCLLAAEIPQRAISNGLIAAKLYLPDAKNGYYRGTRFDWSGVIYSLQYKGHDYYGPWYGKQRSDVHDFIYEGADIVAGAASAIAGPVEEFSTDGTALGYDEARPGEAFVKIGVGGLRRPDAAPYDRYRQYDVLDPGKWTVRSSGDHVEFIQELNGPNGYAYVYRKTVRLAKGQPRMLIEHSLRNTGKRVIASEVYDHNFLVLDRLPPGPGLTITFPFHIEPATPQASAPLEIRGGQIAFRKTLQDRDIASAPIQGFGKTSKDYDIRIENTVAGAGMRITGDRPLSQAALWSIRSVVAVEPFIEFSIQPGSEFTWTFTYDFYTVPAVK
jgi:hypothetical protein